jgi:hypothetical protein
MIMDGDGVAPVDAAGTKYNNVCIDNLTSMT